MFIVSFWDRPSANTGAEVMPETVINAAVNRAAAFVLIFIMRTFYENLNICFNFVVQSITNLSQNLREITSFTQDLPESAILIFMRTVIQRVSEASVTIDGKVHGAIGKGYMVLVGITHTDTEKDVLRMADKIEKLRIFTDENDKMNLSLKQVGGAVLSISQFTLYADCRKGNRPSFGNRVERAEELYLYFNTVMRGKGFQVEEGIFGAEMKVALINDGPVTIVLDTDQL